MCDEFGDRKPACRCKVETDLKKPIGLAGPLSPTRIKT